MVGARVEVARPANSNPAVPSGYNRLHLIRQFYVWGEEVKRSMDWLIKRLIKVGVRVSYHAPRRYIRLASAFPLANYYWALLALGH